MKYQFFFAMINYEYITAISTCINTFTVHVYSHPGKHGE